MSRSDPARRWLLRKPSPDAAARLFCFPYSGVGASMYGRWPRQAGPVEICPVQPPGRENRVNEEHFGDYEDLAEQAVQALEPYLDRPFGFFGHCGGALAAFATALHLQQARGVTTDCLVVSSEVAPHEGPYGRFLHMDDEQLRAELVALTEAMGGVPRPDAIDMSMDVLRADVAANRRYRLAQPAVLGAYLDVVSWRQDDEIRPEQMTGWREYAGEGRFRRTVLDGGHHAFLTAPMPLLDVLRRTFAKADRARRDRT